MFLYKCKKNVFCFLNLMSLHYLGWHKKNPNPKKTKQPKHQQPATVYFFSLINFLDSIHQLYCTASEILLTQWENSMQRMLVNRSFGSQVWRVVECSPACEADFLLGADWWEHGEKLYLRGRIIFLTSHHEDCGLGF